METPTNTDPTLAATATTDAPAETAGEETNVRARIVTVIEDIRPLIQSDGGDLEFVDIDDEGMVYVRLHGACVGCPSSLATLKQGVENYLVEELRPTVKGVELVS